MTIAETSRRIKDGEISPVDLVRGCLDRIARRPELNAFIAVFDERALVEAEAAAAEIGRGGYRGPLHGIPVSIKDLVHMAGAPTTSGSAVPAIHPTSDAPVVRKLRESGAIVIGKTNLHEFAFGTTCDESAFGPVRNPYDTSRSPGGSSGGAAVAVVEEMCLASIGTDTGGSIRIPSAACGIVGLKPTWGELPCEGIVPLSTTCDHVGPMTRTVEDARIVFEALRGPSDGQQSAAGPLTFGVPGGYLVERLDAEVRAALESVRGALEASGHRTRDVDVPRGRSAPDIYLHIVLPEASAWHAPLLERHAGRYSPGVRNRLEMGRYVLAEDYVRAMRLREDLTSDVDTALDECDALLLPALAILAPELGVQSVDIGGRPEPVRAAMLRLTQVFNLTGHPAIALPAGRSRSGLPIGMQLVGRRGETDRLLAVAARVEAQITPGPGSVGGGTG